ncbi:flagellar hook-basal body complex protein FliE [Methylobrevis pamukkalensis]|uniref:Flagellar hook-basal body complex protein FliE n=1 Tax=Methylobrevis pamukkalensis TaxID=1439726 RepID=A0A1E3GX85_9HYPH|nr:flagellar hook-basal body complex protein FliE [Methylobrevis pamukkalensis]ODN68689.1 flagellar hook-basal body protein FliE [Methylobrevis pamukkalensis]
MALTTPVGAANAYQMVSKLANRDPQAQTGVPKADALGGFGDMLRNQMQSVVETGNASEMKQAALVNGKADIVDVVTAVAETEVALGTMVSVRDRVISAYEEIMRMPI